MYYRSIGLRQLNLRSFVYCKGLGKFKSSIITLPCAPVSSLKVIGPWWPNCGSLARYLQLSRNWQKPHPLLTKAAPEDSAAQHLPLLWLSPWGAHPDLPPPSTSPSGTAGSVTRLQGQGLQPGGCMGRVVTSTLGRSATAEGTGMHPSGTNP